MLNVVGVSKQYGSEIALDDVTVRFDPGELTVIVGRSGAGKTTLLRCINDLETPDEGEITLEDEPLASTDAALVFQDGALVEQKSALENVLDGGLAREPAWRELLGWHRPEEKHAAVERLHEVGLAGYADRRVGALSGGQRQRVGIARALHQRPQVLLADEPVASLDPETARSVLDLLARAIDDRNLIGVVSLHQPRLAREVADRFLGIESGRVTFDASASNMSETDLQEVYHSGR